MSDFDSIRREPCIIFKEEGNKPNTSISDIYIVGDIEHPTMYVDAVQIIRNAIENDKITIHLNSPGGDLMTALQICSAIRSSKCRILCNIEGLCFSAATLIFLASHNIGIEDHSVFLFHTYSATVNYKKSHEISSQIAHDMAWGKNLFTKTYSPFLSKEEISGILEGKDLWMDAPEATKRWVKLRKK